MDLTRATNTFRAYLELLLRRTRPRAYPTELSIGTTSFCNLKCVMCPREEHDGNLMPFDVPVDLEYVEAFQPYLRRAREVSLFGLGEPLIDKNYFDKVRVVRREGAEVSLSTNGTLLDEKRAMEFFQTGVRQIGISLDAVTPETYETVRPPGGLPEIEENLQRFVTLRRQHGYERPSLVLSFAMMKPNLHEASRFPEYAASLGADEVVLHSVIYMSRKMKEDLEPDAEEIERVLEAAQAGAERAGILYHVWPLDPMTYLRSLAYGKDEALEEDTLTGAAARRSAPKNGTEPGKPAYCHWLFRNAMVQGKGDVFPCCYMTNHRLGTIGNGTTLQDIRSNTFLAGLRAEHFRGESPGACAGCPQMIPWKPKQLIKDMVRETWGYLRARNGGFPTPESDQESDPSASTGNAVRL